MKRKKKKERKKHTRARTHHSSVSFRSCSQRSLKVTKVSSTLSHSYIYSSIFLVRSRSCASMDSRRINGVRLLSRFSLRARVRGGTTLERSVRKTRASSADERGSRDLGQPARKRLRRTGAAPALRPHRGMKPCISAPKNVHGGWKGPEGREDATRNHRDGQAASRLSTQAWSCAADSTGSARVLPVARRATEKGSEERERVVSRV